MSKVISLDSERAKRYPEPKPARVSYFRDLRLSLALALIWLADAVAPGNE